MITVATYLNELALHALHLMYGSDCNLPKRTHGGHPSYSGFGYKSLVVEKCATTM